MIYSFDLGNSNTGPIGFCADVKADSREEAVERLRELLPEELDAGDDCGREEYIRVYLNGNAVTVEDIVAEEEED